jgi:hypothetical protein
MWSSANYQLLVRAVPLDRIGRTGQFIDHQQEVGTVARSKNVTSHKHRYQLFVWAVPTFKTRSKSSICTLLILMEFAPFVHTYMRLPNALPDQDFRVLRRDLPDSHLHF